MHLVTFIEFDDSGHAKVLRTYGDAGVIPLAAQPVASANPTGTAAGRRRGKGRRPRSTDSKVGFLIRCTCGPGSQLSGLNPSVCYKVQAGWEVSPLLNNARWRAVLSGLSVPRIPVTASKHLRARGWNEYPPAAARRGCYTDTPGEPMGSAFRVTRRSHRH